MTPAENIAHAFNRETANAVHKNYRHLAGTAYRPNATLQGTIEAVAVSPYDEINKWMFLQNYKETGCPLAAIKDYFVPFFDVVLMIKPILESPLLMIDIRSYLTATGQPFMMPAVAGSAALIPRQP